MIRSASWRGWGCTTVVHKPVSAVGVAGVGVVAGVAGVGAVAAAAAAAAVAVAAAAAVVAVAAARVKRNMTVCGEAHILG